MLFWIIATFVAFFIKGLCGFANTLVFTSILGFGVANVNISPVELVMGFPANGIQVWKNRKGLKPSIFVPLVLLVLAGSIPGALLLKNVNAQYLKVFFGIVVVLIGIEMMIREYKELPAKNSRVGRFIVGLCSGVLCGLFGVGVLLAAYVGRTTENSEEFKANLGAVFFIENIMRIITYTVSGVITVESLKMSALMIPIMILGMFTGFKSADILNEKRVKKIVIVLLIISGAMLVIQNI
ncbi:MAG: sulfite exporter TauE/SafE family protein [Lachnospiraceae bacterium]|nr:sulfite exporter TauE/SafE family protein [Lachnospiraceae bacterium]